MASNLILEIASRLDPKGFDDLTKSMENVKTQTQAASKSAGQMADSLGAIKNAVIGTALSLPLINFTREAIRSEEVTAKFQLQLQSLNQSISQSKIEELAQKTRRFGIAETELIQGLSQGLTYLKTTSNEMQLLDTAIGMTVLKGISLGAAFQQIGLIQLGNTRILRQYGITLDKDIKDPTERTAKAIEELRKKMEPMAKESGTLASEMKKAGATMGDIGEKIASSLLPPITAVLKAFNSLSDSTKQTILTIGLVATSVAGVSKIFAALRAAILLLGPANVVAATTTGQLVVAEGFAAAAADTEALAQAKLALAINGAVLAQQKAATSITAFGMTISKANLAFFAITTTIGLLISWYMKWEEQQKKGQKAREDQTVADAAAVKQLQANIDILEEEITTDTDLIAKIKELEDAKKAEADSSTQGLAKSSAQFAASQKDFIAKADEQIAKLKQLEDAEKSAGKITTEEAQKMANVRLFGGETQAEIASLIQLREAYKAAYGEKSDAALAADDKVKASQKKLRQEEVSNQKELVTLKATLAKEAIDEETLARKLGRESSIAISKEQTAKMLAVELQLKKAELEQEKAALGDFWLKNAENRKLLVQKEEAALRKIRLDSARASLDEELALALMTSEEKVKYEEEQAKAKQILSRVSNVGQIGQLSDEEKTLLKTMQDQSLLEAKMAEFAKERAAAAEEESKTRIDFQLGRRVPLTQAELAQKDVQALSITKPQELTLNTKSEINVTIANPGEFASMVAAELQKKWEADMIAAAKNTAAQTTLTGQNLKQ